MVRIFAMKVTEQDFEEDRWKPYLSETRRKAAQGKKNVQDRQLSLGAEALLNKALERVCKGAELPAVYERNIHGKPYLLPPNQKIYVNWSHSVEYVLCAIADREVGVDLQWNQKELKDNFVRRILQEREREFYKRQTPEKRKAVFYEYWVVKESYLKALGTGFQIPLEQFYVELGEGTPRIVQNSPEAAHSEGRIRCVQKSTDREYGYHLPGHTDREYTCRLLDFADKNYTAAVCWEGTDEQGKIEVEYLSQEDG